MKKLEQLSTQIKTLQTDFMALRRLREEANATLTTLPVLP
jgi:prefoldin subunit 5